ncbi:MAG TPA: polysaccharide biosynthesis protein [Firmicutes bacterium]|nr:polysaccharide biosynthesis protein [Bacillota bacterium]
MLSSPLFKGTIILTLASVFSRLLGLGNRMLLARLIGAEGLGLFQMMAPFYSLAAVIATLGLPGAVTKAVSDRFAHQDLYGMEQTKNTALSFVSKSALVGAFLLLFLSYSPLTAYFPDQRIIVPLRLMPLALVFSAVTSIYKGYFQGQENMVPTAVSQVGEQICRVGFGLLGVLLFLPYGLEFAVLGVMAGIVVGEFFSLCTVFFFFRLESKEKPSLRPARHPRFSWQVKKELFALAFPLLIIRLSGSLTFSLESFLIPARLQQAGFSAAEATSQLGNFSGMAVPLLFLPTVVILPLSTALVPAVAKSSSLGLKKRVKHLVILSLVGTFCLGLLTGAVLFLFNEPLLKILYNDAGASPLLVLLAPTAPFAYIQFALASILHGLGRPGIALAFDMLGTSLCLLVIYFLTAAPAYGIRGAAIGYNIGFIVTALLGLAYIYRKVIRAN